MAKVVAYVDKETHEIESVDSLIKRFKKKVANEGIMQELKKREYYKAPSLKRREKSKEAERRRRLAGK